MRIRSILVVLLMIVASTPYIRTALALTEISMTINGEQTDASDAETWVYVPQVTEILFQVFTTGEAWTETMVVNLTVIYNSPNGSVVEPVIQDVSMNLNFTTDTVQFWYYSLPGNETMRVGHYDVNATWADPADTLLASTTGKFAAYTTILGDIFPLQESYTYGELVVFRVNGSLTDLSGETPLIVLITIEIFDPTGYPIARILESTGQDGRVRITTVNSVPPYWPYPPYYPWGQVVFGFTIPHGSIEGNYSYQVTFQIDTTLALGFLDGLDLVYTSTENRSGTFEVEALRLLDVLDAISGLGDSILTALSGVEANVLSAIDDLSTKLDELEASILDALSVIEANVQQILDLIGTPGSTLFEKLAEIKADTEALSAQMTLLEANVLSAVADLSTRLEEVEASILLAIQEVMSGLEEGFAAMESALSEVRSDISSAVEALSDKIDDASDSVTSSLVSQIEATEAELLAELSHTQQLISDTRGDIDALGAVVEDRFDTIEAQITNATRDITSDVSSAVNSAQTTIISSLIDRTGALEQVVTQNFSDASTFTLVLTLLVIITLVLVAIATVRVLRLRPPE